MPYVTTTHTATGTRTVSKDLGYELLPICRPNFIFFKFTNLRPNVPHWIFFDGVDVTNWVNTSYSYNDYADQGRESTLKEPGDEYINATQFPSSLGGPTNNGSGSINSNSDGTLEGVFYLQSNNTLSFSTGKRIFTAIDISVLNKDRCLSFAEGQYSAIGEAQLYNEYTESYTYTYTTTTYVSNNNDYGGGGWEPSISTGGVSGVSATGSSGSTGSTSSSSGGGYADPSYGGGGGYGGYGGGYGGSVGVGVSAEYGGTGGSVSGSNAAGNGCFLPDTLIDMANGTQKAIADLRLGEYTKGGIVTGIHVYDGAPLYEYKGVYVSGTHYVIEENKAIMVKDTSAAVKVADVYGLYTIDTTGRRIFSNGIEFADHNGDGVIVDFFNNMKTGLSQVALVKEIENQISAAQL